MFPNLHDWTLEGIYVDWAKRSIKVSISWTSRECEILIENFSDLKVPRQEEWGGSVSVNSAEATEQSDGSYKLKIEMQTGDAIIAAGRVISFISSV